jgi:O-antigen ligase
MRVMPAALTLLLAWTLFAFGAVYDWTLWPALLLAVAGCIAVRVAERPARDLLQWSLYLAVAAALLQLIPLPAEIRHLLSPAQDGYLLRTSLVAPADGWHPLSLYPEGWIYGAGTLITAVAAFLWSREAMEARGVRRLARSIAWIGLAVSILALVQPALFPNHLIYGFWRPISAGADPVGPIISRNHMAAWLVLAWPLTAGYLISHGRTHWQGRRTPPGVLALSDTRAIWLVLSLALMVGALVYTRSRGGAAAFAIAALLLVVQSWRRIGGAGRAGLAGLVLLVGVAVSFWVTPDPLLNRFERAYSGADGGRPAIWQQTMPIVRDFHLTGIGLGSFEVVMPAYQTASFDALINHAHNQYLHVLTEGGLLVSVPLAVALLAFIRLAWRRVRHDRGPIGHIRQGAWSGLLGLAAMSIFETPLLTPAVAVLAAVSAALVVRQSDGETPSPEGAD